MSWALETDDIDLRRRHAIQRAASDGAQSITQQALAELTPVLRRIAEEVGREL